MPLHDEPPDRRQASQADSGGAPALIRKPIRIIQRAGVSGVMAVKSAEPVAVISPAPRPSG